GRHHERRVRSHAPRDHRVTSPGGREQRARDRARRNRRGGDRGGDARRDPRRMPSRRRGNHGGELRRQAGAASLPPSEDPGSVGRDLGRAMAGGRIDVHGSAGENAGGALPGAARGMTGGEMVIRGDAGAQAGAAARRGLIVVTGTAGPQVARGMIAGTVVVFGRAGPGAGRFLKRGSIVALGAIERPATFGYACTYRPPYVALLLRYLRARYGLAIADRQVTGRYERHVGDLAELGKGEI